jgi:hypothetical protein
MGQKIFVGFLEELKTLKSPFEINWPLGKRCGSLWLTVMTDKPDNI